MIESSRLRFIDSRLPLRVLYLQEPVDGIPKNGLLDVEVDGGGEAGGDCGGGLGGEDGGGGLGEAGGGGLGEAGGDGC